MKKWIAGLIIILLIVIAYLYLFIPDNLSFRRSVSFNSNSEGFKRSINDEKNWKKWWPGKIDSLHSLPSFTYNERTYTIVEKKFNSLVISIRDGDTNVNTLLNFISPTKDSVHLIWIGHLSTSSSPLNRLITFNNSKHIEKDVDLILGKMMAFAAKPQNIYDADIRESVVMDSLLISTSETTSEAPTIEIVYGLIRKLRNYIDAHSAKETGTPMLHVTKESGRYLTRVAIPVDRRLDNSGNISFKWMMGGGRILVTEVKGGPYAIHKAFQKLELFIRDHQMASPAIPFESLVTDRSKERDTSKWVTRLYYPIM